MIPRVAANGANIPALGYGTWRVAGADALRMIPAVLRLGYRHIDTAQIYGNEAEVGEAIAGSGVPRAEVFLTTKVWPDRYRKADFARSVDESLKKLRTDYVDLLLLHWPRSDVPLAERIGALNEAARQGKARHIGVSNFPSVLLGEAIMLSEAPLAVNQVEYHPFLDQSPVLDTVRRAGMALVAYYAMAKGKVLDEPVLADIARSHGRTVAQVVLRWLVQQDPVVALTKTVREERAAENAAIFDFELSAEDMGAILALGSRKGRLLDPPDLAVAWD